MANSNHPDSANPQNMSTNSGDPPPVLPMGGPTVLATVSEPIASMASSMPTNSIAHTGPILNFIRPRGPPQTPPPIGTSMFTPFMPPRFSMPSSGRDQPYGIPTSMMANLQSALPVFSEPVMTSPLQGPGSGANMGRNTQPLGMGYSTRTPNLTNNFAAVIRQQMDESNHGIVQMLAQTMGTILNPLIQNTT
ncbi:uncharacterized protein LOC127094533 [Lathyrus oleraceus]|uniref:uncharacterized protein LOC127094533 n=1 Tax=Pisum sativum TaxID=3888 RepID=UPI0021D3C1BA|nr:uncharacterized protein LOC127094533 [Pisum sativum]